MINEKSKNVETTGKILGEVMTFCDEVISGERKVDATFFTTKREAARLREACARGDAEGALCELRTYGGEQSPADLIRRLEAAIARGLQKSAPVGVISSPVLPAAPVDGICSVVELIPIESIETDSEAAGMFERNPAVAETVRESMANDGFHNYEPVKVWDLGNGKYKLCDGHTRTDAARELARQSIPAIKRHYSSHDEFLQAAVDAQIGRRNLSTRDKFAVVRYSYPVEAENARKRHGGQSAGNSADSAKGRADEIIGGRIGYSADTVSKIRALVKAGDTKILESVFKGEQSISGAYEALKPKASANCKPASPACAAATRHTASVPKIASSGNPAVEKAAPATDAGKSVMLPAEVLRELVICYQSVHPAGLGEEMLARCNSDTAQVIMDIHAGSRKAAA